MSSTILLAIFLPMITIFLAAIVGHLSGPYFPQALEDFIDNFISKCFKSKVPSKLSHDSVKPIVKKMFKLYANEGSVIRFLKESELLKDDLKTLRRYEK